MGGGGGEFLQQGAKAECFKIVIMVISFSLETGKVENGTKILFNVAF